MVLSCPGGVVSEASCRGLHLRVGFNLDGFGQADLAFSGLLKPVRTGEPAYQDALGNPLWENRAANQDRISMDLRRLVYFGGRERTLEGFQGLASRLASLFDVCCIACCTFRSWSV